MVRSTKVDRAVFDAADKLALVIRAGAGTNTIDVEAAARHGVLVCNVPGRNAVAVAELTMGLILALDRRIADNVAGARQGVGRGDVQQGQRTARQHPRHPRHGSIGLAVAERPTGFGMRIGYLDRPGRSRATRDRLAELNVVCFGSLPELLASSDVVSLGACRAWLRRIAPLGDRRGWRTTG